MQEISDAFANLESLRWFIFQQSVFSGCLTRTREAFSKSPLQFQSPFGDVKIKPKTPMGTDLKCLLDLAEQMRLSVRAEVMKMAEEYYQVKRHSDEQGERYYTLDKKARHLFRRLISLFH